MGVLWEGLAWVWAPSFIRQLRLLGEFVFSIVNPLQWFVRFDGAKRTRSDNLKRPNRGEVLSVCYIFWSPRAVRPLRAQCQKMLIVWSCFMVL